MKQYRLILQIIGIITIVSTIMTLNFIISKFYPNWILNKAFNAPGIYLLVPFLILYFNIDEYFSTIYEGKIYSFAKVIVKCIISSLVVGGILGVVISNTCSGESCLGILVAWLIGVGGLLLSLIVSSITYLIYKRNIRINAPKR